MIEITFYNNGFEINGHAEPDVCHQVSITAWMISNLIMHNEPGDWYTSDYDNSPVGYTHFTFENINAHGIWLLSRFKAYLQEWSTFYRWDEQGHLKIQKKPGDLVIPADFKKLKGIVVNS